MQNAVATYKKNSGERKMFRSHRLVTPEYGRQVVDLADILLRSVTCVLRAQAISQAGEFGGKFRAKLHVFPPSRMIYAQ